MKRGKILKILLIVGIILLIGIFLWSLRRKEGFKIQTLNVDYTPKEVYMVGQILNPNDLYNDPPASRDVYANAFVYDDAIKVCEKYGGQLATKEQLQRAVDLSGHWCKRGWIAGDRDNAYFPSPMANACKGYSQGGGRAIQTATDLTTGRSPNKAFAICYGPKTTADTFDIQDFNKDVYSVFDVNNMATYVMNGPPATVGTKDANGIYSYNIYPTIFTRTQALYALEQNNYNQNAAREYLITQMNSAQQSNARDDPLNRAITNAAGSELYETGADAEKWNGVNKSKEESCNSLQNFANTVANSLKTLRGLFSDVSGMTMTAIQMKTENGYLQSVVSDICRSTSNPTEACTRLLALDYDIFYRDRTVYSTDKTKTNALLPSYLLDDLENLNFGLALRECELQQILGSLEFLNTKLECNVSFKRFNGTSFTTNHSMNTFTTNVVDYKDKDGNMQNMPIQCGQNLSDSDKEAAFKVGRDIEYNAVDRLKKSFEQISPYYSNEQFTKLVNTILDRLNTVLEPPDNTKFLKYDGIFNNSLRNLYRIHNILLNSDYSIPTIR